MFPETWRKHWALDEDPFVHEDADKDPVLSKIDAVAVNSSFDRIFGDPRTPRPGVVFGEKGSGKSGLRLAMQRRLEAHNELHTESRVFVSVYSDFDYYLDHVRQFEGIQAGTARTSAKLAECFGLIDHLDAILSLGVTQLVDDIVEKKRRGRRLDRKHKNDFLALATLYYHSEDRSRPQAVEALRRRLRNPNRRTALLYSARIALSILGVALLLFPHLDTFGLAGDGFDPGPGALWRGLGFTVLAATWIGAFASHWGQKRRASRTVRSVRAVPQDVELIRSLLGSLGRDARADLLLPTELDEPSRYRLLSRFIGLLLELGYGSFYVLMDRVDEAALLGGKEDFMQPFVEKLMRHKLLQYKGLALKLFLPIELSKVQLGAGPAALKNMRLDKAGTVPDLRWSGQELYEIASKRLAAARSDDCEGAPGGALIDYLEEGIEIEHVREALNGLGTPRHAQGFLASLFAEYARNLPEDLDDDSERWRIPRSHFDIIRAGWSDQSRTLRRVLN